MNTIRFSGLASGFDTQSIVDSLMRVERLPLDRLKQNKQLMEWKRDDYREVNTKLQSFRDSLLTMRLQSTFMSKTVASTNDAKVTATASSTAGDVTYTMQKVTQLATAATNSSAGAMSANATNKMDPTKSLFSQRDKFDAGAFTWKQTAVQNGAGEWERGTTESLHVRSAGQNHQLASFTTGGEIQTGAGNAPLISVTDESGTVTNFNVVTDANASLGANDVRLNTSTGALSFGSQLAAGSSIQAEYASVQKDTLTAPTATNTVQLRQSGVANFSRENGEEVLKVKASGSEDEQVFKRKDTLSGLAADEFFVDDTGKVTFGSQLAAGSQISAEYSYQFAEAKLTVHGENGPVDHTIKIDAKETLNQFITKLNTANIGVNMFYDQQSDRMSITRTATGDFNPTGAEMEFAPDSIFATAFKMTNAEQGGTNAKFQLNGLETERSSNSFTINGMSFTLKGTFEASEGSVSLTSTNNTQSAVDAIKKFVEDYNKLVDDVNGKVRESVDRDYKPLTDEQRETLSEKEIEKWEERARSGMLRNDQFLSSALSGMRSKFYERVDTGGTFSQLTQIGITTTSNFSDGGKLQINEEKLKAALEKDPDSVYQLFASDAENGRGVARTIGDTVTESIRKITNHAGGGLLPNQSFTLGRNLDSNSTQISDLERRLQATEDRYWKQFSAFESAMQRQNDQLSYMMSQLGMAPQQ